MILLCALVAIWIGCFGLLCWLVIGCVWVRGECLCVFGFPFAFVVGVVLDACVCCCLCFSCVGLWHRVAFTNSCFVGDFKCSCVWIWLLIATFLGGGVWIFNLFT